MYFTAGLNDYNLEDKRDRLHKQDIDENGIFVKPPTDDAQLKIMDGRHALLAVGFDSKKTLPDTELMGHKLAKVDPE